MVLMKIVFYSNSHIPSTLSFKVGHKTYTVFIEINLKIYWKYFGTFANEEFKSRIKHFIHDKTIWFQIKGICYQHFQYFDSFS